MPRQSFKKFILKNEEELLKIYMLSNIEGRKGTYLFKKTDIFLSFMSV